MKKNFWVEEWNGRREITERSFVLGKPKNLAWLLVRGRVRFSRARSGLGARGRPLARFGGELCDPT